MILSRTHFERAWRWACGRGMHNTNCEQQSFYQLNRLYQQTQRLLVSQFVRLA